MSRADFLRKAFQCLGNILVVILVGGGLVLTIFWIIYGSISAWGAVGLAILFFLMFMVLYTIFEQRLKEWWS